MSKRIRFDRDRAVFLDGVRIGHIGRTTDVYGDDIWTLWLRDTPDSLPRKRAVYTRLREVKAAAREILEGA